MTRANTRPTRGVAVQARLDGDRMRLNHPRAPQTREKRDDSNDADDLTRPIRRLIDHISCNGIPGDAGTARARLREAARQATNENNTRSVSPQQQRVNGRGPPPAPVAPTAPPQRQPTFAERVQARAAARRNVRPANSANFRDSTRAAVNARVSNPRLRYVLAGIAYPRHTNNPRNRMVLGAGLRQRD